MLKLIGDKLTKFLLARIREESTAGNAKKKSRFFHYIIMDETQDIRRREQVSICIRFVNAQLQYREVFFGFFHTKTTDANTLLDLLKKTLHFLNLPLEYMRGQGYDDAADMSGKNIGLLIHYSTVLDLLEMSQIDGDLKADKRAEARAHVRGLEEFSTYFHIHVFQKLLSITNPIHTMCQGRTVTVGDVRSWVNSLCRPCPLLTTKQLCSISR